VASSGMTVFFPVVWLKIMYSPGATTANCCTFDLASSKVSAAAFQMYVPSCILKISKGGSTVWDPFLAYCRYSCPVREKFRSMKSIFERIAALHLWLRGSSCIQCSRAYSMKPSPSTPIATKAMRAIDRTIRTGGRDYLSAVRRSWKRTLKRLSRPL
jgi:hypothetical protein